MQLPRNAKDHLRGSSKKNMHIMNNFKITLTQKKR